MVDLQAVFRYLDDLRESGVVNMFGAGEYLRDEFEMGRAESHRVLGLWMRTFNGAMPVDARANEAVTLAAVPRMRRSH